MDDKSEKLLQNVLLWGTVIVGGYFVVVKPLLGAVGIDPQTQALIDAENNLPPSQNPFNASFQPFVDFYNNNAPDSYISYSGGFNWQFFTSGAPVVVNQSPTIGQFFQSLKALYVGGSLQPSVWGFLDSAALTNLSEQLHAGIHGGFVVPVEGDILAPLSQLGSKLQLAFVANYFYWNYNEDLFSSLNGGIIKRGLAPSDFAALIQRVNNFPLT